MTCKLSPRIMRLDQLNVVRIEFGPVSALRYTVEIRKQIQHRADCAPLLLLGSPRQVVN